MIKKDTYPRVIINLNKLRENAMKMQEICAENGIEIAGVVKGCCGLLRCAQQLEKAGCRFIASSRIGQLKTLKQQGIKTPLMLIRTPMISEADQVVELTDISLNSDLEVLEELNRKAELIGKKHKVILMQDLGDLREGFWDKQELFQVAIRVENNLQNLHLAGVGTNLGCYGAIESTPEKLQELVATAEEVEKIIGRRLEFISERATGSFPRVIDGNIPKRVNLLRMGEGILLARDLQELWGYDMSFMNQDVFTLEAEIIEVRDKPTYPQGTIGFDAFGNKPVYEDRGVRKRAIAAVGKFDYGSINDIFPVDEGVSLVGASSDHTILDVEDCKKTFKPGDIVSFDIAYAAMMYLTSSGDVNKIFVE